MTRRKITVAIAEDHNLVAEGYASLLKNSPRIRVQFCAKNGTELIERLITAQVDIVLLDIEMPVMDGREALTILNKNFPAIKVIVITSHYHPTFMADFIKGGACAFLPKNIYFKSLEQTILNVYKHGAFISSEVSAIVAKIAEESGGTTSKSWVKDQFEKTELKIVSLLCQQKSPPEVAKQLNTDLITVNWFVDRILRKMDADSLDGLKLFAVENDLL